MRNTAKARTRASGSPRRRLGPVLLGAGLSLLAFVAMAWWAVHRFEWAGPLVANTLRSLIGVDAVAKLEDSVYAAEDRFNRFWRSKERPQAYWVVPPEASVGPAPADSAAPGEPVLSAFRPANVGPVHQSWSAPGDGVWVPVPDPRHPHEDARVQKTLLHPDANRSWAEVFVFAVDLRRVRLHVVPGYQEPKALTKLGAEKMKERTPARPAIIPAADHADLIAAFNGGFMAEHGYYGMMVDGVTLVDPRKTACTVAMYPGDVLRIRTFGELESTLGDMSWYRQTPACMIESGTMHGGLLDPKSRTWGATLDGETVIRRSAIGLNERGDVLLIGLGNSTTARVIAAGLKHAGAAHVAQLDVNWSYPKLLFYQPGPSGELVAIAAAPGFEFDEGEYVRKRAMRDFFYLTRKEPVAATPPPSHAVPVAEPAASADGDVARSTSARR